MRENRTAVDFVFIKRALMVYIKCEGTPLEFQHALVMADIDKRKIRKVERKTCAERRKTSLLKDVEITK